LLCHQKKKNTTPKAITHWYKIVQNFFL